MATRSACGLSCRLGLGNRSSNWSLGATIAPRRRNSGSAGRARDQTALIQDTVTNDRITISGTLSAAKKIFPADGSRASCFRLRASGDTKCDDSFGIGHSGKLVFDARIVLREQRPALQMECEHSQPDTAEPGWSGKVQPVDVKSLREKCW